MYIHTYVSADLPDYSVIYSISGDPDVRFATILALNYVLLGLEELRNFITDFNIEA
jgi:hypothetical protein